MIWRQESRMDVTMNITLKNQEERDGILKLRSIL